MSQTMMEDKKTFFETHGYVIMEGCIDASLLKNIQKGYHQVVRGEVRAPGWNWRPGEMLQLGGSCAVVPELKNSPHIDIILNVARQLTGSDIEFWYDQLIYKPASSVWETPWHQDSGYWGDMKEFTPALTAWLAVEDVDEHMGCMSFIPGSHKLGRVRHVDVSKTNPISGALEAEADFSRVVKVPLKAGDVSFHHKHTLHHTTGNQSSRGRCGLVHHLKGSDA